MAPIGAPAVMGATAGFFLAGFVLLPNVEPYILYLLSLACLSAGALIQGRVLEGWIMVSSLQSTPGFTGDLRLERRETGGSGSPVKVLLEGGRVRGAEDRHGKPARGWENAVLEGMLQEEGLSGSILFLGGGLGTLARLTPPRRPPSRILAVERTRELFELVRSQLPPGEEREDVVRLVGDPLKIPLEPGSSFDLILVDGGILPRLGPAPVLQESDWRFLAGTLDDSGIMVLGGLRGEGPGGCGALEDLVRRGRGFFAEVLLYGASPGWKYAHLLPESGGEEERLVVLGHAGGPEWPPLLPGFRALPPPGA